MQIFARYHGQAFHFGTKQNVFLMPSNLGPASHDAWIYGMLLQAFMIHHQEFIFIRISDLSVKGSKFDMNHHLTIILFHVLSAIFFVTPGQSVVSEPPHEVEAMQGSPRAGAGGEATPGDGGQAGPASR